MNFLSRKVPQNHPQFYWLYANRVAVQGETFSQKKANFGEPYDEYNRYWLTVHYQAPPYKIYSDAQVRSGEFKEYDRWVEKLPEPYTDIVTMPGEEWKWSAAQGNPSGAVALPNTVGVRIFRAQETVRWIWHQVPEFTIFTSNLVATNIRAALNTMNDDTFAGYSARTLLLHGAKYTPIHAPVAPPVVGQTVIPRLWTVELTFLFDPNGWHKAIDPQDREYYQIETSNGGDLLYNETDFENIFTSLI